MPKLRLILGFVVLGLPVAALICTLWCLWGTPESNWFGYLLLETPAVVFLAMGILCSLAALMLKRKWFWLIPLGTGIVGAWVMARPALGSKSAQVEDLRVMTYNILYGNRGLEDIAATILSENPDIVCLQECYTYRPNSPVLSMLLQKLPNYQAFDVGDIVILSKFPILERKVVPFPGNEKVRPLIRATISVRGTRICVINAHFVASRLDLHPGVAGFLERFGELGSIHQKQTEVLLAQLPEEDMPVVVCGDFNHPPLGKSYRDMLAAGLKDSFAMTSRGLGFTLPSEFAVKRIDYIWGNDQLRPLRSRVPNVPSSDHLPVVSDFAWVKN